MQTRNYTCGPAALATLLQNLGINTTEDELADLAETTEDGTTMQGLIKAAKGQRREPHWSETQHH
ncbi:cysteine peptidase family C39 domain-containing protein [Methanothermobacter sp. DP]|uniref:cysteine peptidase family C39 domain-containing protein n=1 Tax=Methanothermobacter TaxID=145260 RepID=UPI002AA52336|nr:cysteine peptidase family C39 domain-containing protein [Methanothermobacter sp. DP]